MLIKRVLFFLFILIDTSLSQKTEGDTCVVEHTNTVGKCTRSENCHTAREDLQTNGILPTFCSYTFDGALVCCHDGSSILQVASTTPASDYRPVWSSGDATTYASKRISEKKCAEYSRGVIQTVNFLPLLPDGQPLSVSSAKCDYSGLELIVGGETAQVGEFPHMALVGWVNFEDTYTFACGGTLISPRFVMTAGHCVNSPDPRYKDPKPAVVRLAEHNTNPSVNDGANPVEVPIKKIHRHPEYKPPQRYNDIALLELATNVDFDASVRPACLWTNDDFGGSTKAIATGWGVYNTRTSETSSELMKVSLDIYSNEYCDSILADRRNRNWQGFRETQMCAGELRGGKDTCQGDSGGPLQLASKDNRCIFYIVGITSFGHKCAELGLPAIYTRVSRYLDWIESVVWPGEN